MILISCKQVRHRSQTIYHIKEWTFTKSLVKKWAWFAAFQKTTIKSSFFFPKRNLIFVWYEHVYITYLRKKLRTAARSGSVFYFHYMIKFYRKSKICGLVYFQCELLKLHVFHHKRVFELQGLLGNLGTEISGLLQIMCSDMLSLLVFLFGVRLAFTSSYWFRFS